MMRRSVDLPQPDGPRSATNSPASMSSETSVSTWSGSPLSWNARDTPRSSTDVRRSEIVTYAYLAEQCGAAVVSPFEQLGGGQVVGLHRRLDQTESIEREARSQRPHVHIHVQDALCLRERGRVQIDLCVGF